MRIWSAANRRRIVPAITKRRSTSNMAVVFDRETAPPSRSEGLAINAPRVPIRLCKPPFLSVISLRFFSLLLSSSSSTPIGSLDYIGLIYVAFDLFPFLARPNSCTLSGDLVNGFSFPVFAFIHTYASVKEQLLI